MQYKRPAIRKRTYGSRVCAVSPYAVGLVADLARALRDARVPPAPQKEWRPSVEYEYIAKHLPEEEGAALIARSEAWFAANPTPVRAAAARPVLDYTPILALYAKYPGKRAPLEEEIAAFRAAGMSEERVEKHRAHMKKLEETSEERQKALDAIFAKYPSANKPNKPKTKKVIKAVQKKINNGGASAPTAA